MSYIGKLNEELSKFVEELSDQDMKELIGQKQDKSYSLNKPDKQFEVCFNFDKNRYELKYEKTYEPIGDWLDFDRILQIIKNKFNFDVTAYRYNPLAIDLELYRNYLNNVYDRKEIATIGSLLINYSNVFAKSYISNVNKIKQTPGFDKYNDYDQDIITFNQTENGFNGEGEIVSVNGMPDLQTAVNFAIEQAKDYDKEMYKNIEFKWNPNNKELKVRWIYA